MLSFLLLFSAIATPALAAGAVPKSVMQATESVVRILAEYPDGSSSGSGFVIKSNDETTLIATNHHVVEDDPYRISVWLGENETIEATILTSSQAKDLCVLELDKPVSLKALTLSEKGASQGDAVYAVGYPAAADDLSDKEAHTGADATITDGIISAIRETTISFNGDPVTLLQINAAINSGNSGGPLFNTKGEVIGINTYGTYDSQGISGAIGVNELREHLDSRNISVDAATNNLWSVLIIAAVVVCAAIVFVIIFKQRKKKQRIKNTAGNSAGKVIAKPLNNAGTQKVVVVKVAAHKNVQEPENPVDAPLVTETETPKKPRKSRKLIISVAIVSVIVLVVGGYFGCYFGAYAYAKNGDIEMAAKLLFAPQVTKIHDSELSEYVAAGQLLESGEYDMAMEKFSELDGYLDAQTKVLDTRFKQGEFFLESGDLGSALRAFTDLESVGYKGASEMVYKTLDQIGNREGWYEAWIHLTEDSNYSDAENLIEYVAEKLYGLAVEEYRNGNRITAISYYIDLEIFFGENFDSEKYPVFWGEASDYWEQKMGDLAKEIAERVSPF